MQSKEWEPSFSVGDNVSFVSDPTKKGKISSINSQEHSYLIKLDSSAIDTWANESDITLITQKVNMAAIESCPLCANGDAPTYKCGHVGCNAHFHIKDLLSNHELTTKHSCPSSCEICQRLAKYPSPTEPERPRRGPRKKSSPDHSEEVIGIVVPPEMKQKFSFDYEKISAGVVIPIPKEINCNVILAKYREQLKSEQWEKVGVTKNYYVSILLGIEETFNVALARTLLYKNERRQWGQYITQMESDARVMVKKPSFVFGAEHLARLLVTLPNLLVEAKVARDKWNPILMIANDLLRFISENLSTFWTDGYSVILDD